MSFQGFARPRLVSNLVRTATQGTITYRTMKKVAPENADVAERLNLFEHRVVEEFYDYAADPDALVNLVDDPRYQDETGGGAVRGER